MPGKEPYVQNNGCAKDRYWQSSTLRWSMSRNVLDSAVGKALGIEEAILGARLIKRVRSACVLADRYSKGHEGGCQ